MLRVLIIYSSAKFRRRIPIDVGNRFFCSVFLGYTVETDVEVDEGFLRFLLRIGFVERPETIPCAGHWFGHSLRPQVPQPSCLSDTQSHTETQQVERLVGPRIYNETC